MVKKRSASHRSASMEFGEAARQSISQNYDADEWTVQWAFFSPDNLTAWVWLSVPQFAAEVSTYIYKDRDGWFYRTEKDGRPLDDQGPVDRKFHRVALQCYQELAARSMYREANLSL